MPTIDELKELEAAPTPLFLFECVLRNGTTERWGTHAVSFDGHDYDARLLRHNLFELKASSEEGFDGAAKISVTLANADSRFSEIERETGFKGSQITVRFLFFDLVAGEAASEARVVFRGSGGNADEITESALRVTFANRLNLQRILLPEVRIGRRCPWLFPSNEAQRIEAVDGGAKGKYSALYRCGYSADQTGGVGNLSGGDAFTSCDYTRSNCVERGMFDKDSSNRPTARFGGVEFVPAQILVRSTGEKGQHLSPVVENEARYNDVVPIVYGTAWYNPPVVFARNDGNLTRMEVLLGMGQMDDVVKVIVNDVEIPEGVSGQNMTGTGFFNIISLGSRNGAFNPNFADGGGNPLGDPYGNMALLSVVVPTRIASGQAIPKVAVLARGVLLERFDEDGGSIGEGFSNNPAWVLLDVLRRSGWKTSEIDLKSFASAADYCDETVDTTDLYANAIEVRRFQCNLVVRSRISAAELAKGIRSASSLMLTYGGAGLLTLRVENTLALQQAVKPDGSNSVELLNGGWPVYEFSDGSAGFSGILRVNPRTDVRGYSGSSAGSGGEPTLRVFSKSGSEAANRLSVEFQDEFNEYQQDSLSLVDVDDALLTGREVTASFQGLGLPNFDQAARMLDLQLSKSIRGNTFVQFETTVRGVGLTPGDLIALIYIKEGWERQAFRIVRLAPGVNFQTLLVTAQIHDDGWYTSGGASAAGGRRRPGSDLGLPRPLVGTEVDTNGVNQFGITEEVTPGPDGGFMVKLSAAFVPPAKPQQGGSAIPLVGLSPTISTTGGTLKGGQNLYYAVSAVDGTGIESELSFIVRAKIPSTTNTNKVTINGLSLSPGTAGFHVYRGVTPSQLLRIAHDVAVTGSFADAGATAETVGPPDANYDHANFYWRTELEPETNVGIHSATTIGNSSMGMLSNEFKGAAVRITRGKGAAQERVVIGNTATTLTVGTPWTIEPDATSYFTVAEGTWKFGGVGGGSPVAIEVANFAGITVQISGRSANVHDNESAAELNPLTRWQIEGGGSGADSDVPPAPSLALNPLGQGTVELVAIGFPALDNTHTIEAGTLEVVFWDELLSPTPRSLSSGVTDTATSITITPAPSTAYDTGRLLQIEGEVVEVVSHGSGGTYTVVRGAWESTAAAHASGSLVYALESNLYVVPFVKGFFGSPASGSFSFPIFLPDTRIAAVSLFVTNAVGDSPVTKASFGGLVDKGIRTFSGGQISIQIEGYLSTQTFAAPALMIEDSHAARDIFAVVREAPDGGDVTLRLRQGSATWVDLTIADGETLSNVVKGFGLGKLAGGEALNLDVLGVPGAANTLPGRDLTVTIRL